VVCAMRVLAIVVVWAGGPQVVRLWLVFIVVGRVRVGGVFR